MTSFFLSKTHGFEGNDRKLNGAKEVEVGGQEGSGDQRVWLARFPNWLIPERRRRLLGKPVQGTAVYPVRGGPPPIHQAEGLSWGVGEAKTVLSKLQMENGAQRGE